MTQFQQNEKRGRVKIEKLFAQLECEVNFNEEEYASHDFAFEYKGKKCIGEVKYLYKYSSQAFNEAYLEMKKAKLMEAEKGELEVDKMFYFFIHNDGVCRIFDITNYSRFNTIDKYAPKSYSDKIMIMKEFIRLTNTQGIEIKI